jgi:uncharacterized protein (DUF927 family)
VPWAKDDAKNAAGACFKAWLTARGGPGSAEVKQALQAVTIFMALHGASRFEHLKRDPDLPFERVINRAGYVRTIAVKDKNGMVVQDSNGNDIEERQFLIFPEVWKGEICKGLDPTLVTRTVRDAGHLLPDADRIHLMRNERIPEHGQMRLYVLKASILGGSNE